MASKPNFLLISADQLRWDALGCSGNSIVRTPALDALSAGGTRFTRAYPTNPICMPARASLITGRSQRGHQVFDHDVSLGEELPFVGDSLQEAGYATALFGKAHFKRSVLEDRLAQQPSTRSRSIDGDGFWHGPYYGFEYVSLSSSLLNPRGHWGLWLEKEHPEGLQLCKMEAALEPPTGAIQCWKSALPAEWHPTHWNTDRTIEWLHRQDGTQPFFGWLSVLDPHHPFCPPAPYCDLYDPDHMPDPLPPEVDLSRKPPPYRWQREGKHMYRGEIEVGRGGEGRHAREIKALYYGMVTFVDHQVGRVLAEIDRLGLRDNTHVIFTSDHGDALMDHGVFGKPPLAYESIVRVPLLWRSPSCSTSGQVHEGVTTQLDFVPTVLDLAGASPLSGMEGRSFVPILRGDAVEHRDAVIVERIAVERTHGHPVVRYKMLITQRWKLVVYGTPLGGELYDLETDPHQSVNLWDTPEHHSTREALTARLLQEMIDDELGDPATVLRRQREVRADRAHA